MEEMAQAAVEGAVDAAASIGTTAGRAVKEILVGAVQGVREVADAAFPAKGSAAPEYPSTNGAQQKTRKGALAAHSSRAGVPA